MFNPYWQSQSPPSAELTNAHVTNSDQFDLRDFTVDDVWKGETSQVDDDLFLENTRTDRVLG